MLVLSRKRMERIVIETPSGEIITIVVTELRREVVRFGIDAPQEVKIWRQELFDARAAAADQREAVAV